MLSPHQIALVARATESIVCPIFGTPAEIVNFFADFSGRAGPSRFLDRHSCRHYPTAPQPTCTVGCIKLDFVQNITKYMAEYRCGAV